MVLQIVQVSDRYHIYWAQRHCRLHGGVSGYLSLCLEPTELSGTYLAVGGCPTLLWEVDGRLPLCLS